jgi:thiosulfate dehydrogenase
MMNRQPGSIFNIAVAIGVSLAIFYYFFHLGKPKSQTQSYLLHKQTIEKEALEKLNHNFVDPDLAPQPIRELAELGFRAMISTSTYAKGFVGDKLHCTSCHFAGGNTAGGAQGGISLVGTAARYPAYDSASKKVLSLEGRINSCFTKSMNGKAIPLDSELMLGFVTYLHWISKDIPIYGNIPWLGLQPLSSTYEGNSSKGKGFYDKYCSICHREDGQGGVNNPPLWGAESFNKNAGMHHLPTLASFIFWNMPFDDNTPVLSEDEALDVAAYVLSNPRE